MTELETLSTVIGINLGINIVNYFLLLLLWNRRDK